WLLSARLSHQAAWTRAACCCPEADLRCLRNRPIGASRQASRLRRVHHDQWVLALAVTGEGWSPRRGEQLCSGGPGSPMVRATSRLALRATARCAAAALTRPARWALGPSDGRHGVPASVSVGPAVTIAEHRVKGGEHFAYDRDDRDFRLLARGNE